MEKPSLTKLMKGICEEMPKVCTEVKRGVKAGIEPVVRKLDMVGREEFDIQKHVLTKLHARLDELEGRLDSLSAAKPDEGKE